MYERNRNDGCGLNLDKKLEIQKEMGLLWTYLLANGFVGFYMSKFMYMLAMHFIKLTIHT